MTQIVSAHRCPRNVAKLHYTRGFVDFNGITMKFDTFDRHHFMRPATADGTSDCTIFWKQVSPELTVSDSARPPQAVLTLRKLLCVEFLVHRYPGVPMGTPDRLGLFIRHCGSTMELRKALGMP